MRFAKVAKQIFLKAVNSVKPSVLITENELIKFKNIEGKEFLEIVNKCFDITNKNLYMIGFGKAVLSESVEMDRVLGNRIVSGIISVPVGAKENVQLLPNSNVIIYEGAAGNFPDENSQHAAKEIKKLVENLTENDVLFVLISGGGSALLPLPIHPITLEEKISLIKNLSRCGATIQEINTIRIALSQLKGGKLAMLGHKAHKIISLIMSDIINDPLDLISSGPTVPYNLQKQSAKKILENYNLFQTLPSSIYDVIQKDDDENNSTETPLELKNSEIFLIGNNRIAIDAAMEETTKNNLNPVFLSSEVQGNVIQISEAYFHLSIAIKNFNVLSEENFRNSLHNVCEVLSAQDKFVDDLIRVLKSDKKKDGICIVAGGEATVTVLGSGLGGRNQELALRFTKLCHDAQNHLLNDLLLLSAGTDGIDGNNVAAGALGGPKVLSQFIKQSEANKQDNSDVKKNISIIMDEFIYNNDSFSFFRNFLSKYSTDSYHIITGHTNTNVMDLHLLIIPN
ncbi:unnamed protein product [Diamesa serratosioi]